MQNKDFYTTTHLIVAAIRVHEHQNNAAPSVDDICRSLSFSLEQGHFICNKLDEIEIIEIVRGAYGARLFIKDHLKIEEIPRAEKGSSLREEIEKFQNTKKDFEQKIESFQAEKAERQKTLFAEIESRLRQKTDAK
ncbi:hypothetical protein [Desulfonema magnum]|uniref:Uncharacterized protein n=1 Tax=Desulfonema magnum TaxID=45655 RepID=A0A975GL76_9BACT|nr:hypothetical protein [Desulfonema magnum]QTA85482.1 Uncharacterized protein dnm_014930 [Desulfonema magnum]